jgi:hypothetical protein
MILLGAAVAVAPAQLLAQSTNKASTTKKTTTTTTTTTEKKDATAKKPAAHPFHGKLVSVDKVAKTITLGKSTYQITSESKIKKADKPATLDDGVVGEDVSGYAKPTDDGKMVATTVNFGPKAASTTTTTTTTDKKKSTEKTK